MSDKEVIAAIEADARTPPTPLARRFVRYLLGFFVGVAVGLAPYLGLLRIPFFAPLLDLIPESIQNTIIPLSAALMGLVAVVTQWYGGERLSRAWLRQSFMKALLIAGVSFLALVVIHNIVVAIVPIRGGKDAVSFIVGFTRPSRPPCTEEVSDTECIKLLTFDTTSIDSFWGDRQIRLARLALMLPYLAFTSFSGALIGLLLLRETIMDKKINAKIRRR